MTSLQYKYLSFTQGSAELVRAMTGVGAFSNAYHLRTLSEEQSDGNKDQDISYEPILEVILSGLKGTDKRLLLHSKITVAWMSVHSTTIVGAVLSTTEFRGFYVLVITSLP